MTSVHVRLIQITCLALMAALTLVGCGNGEKTEDQPLSSPREKVTNVALSTVIRQDIQETFTLPGTLEAWEDLTLAAEMAGPVRWIGPKEGDRLKKGDAILRIDPERREAELTRDQIEFELQQKHLERRRVLVERGLVSQQEYEDARKTFEQAQARLHLSKVALDKSTLRSPVDGVLDRLLVDRGEYVSEGDAAVVVMQVDRLRALVDVPEKEILDLAVGGKALIFAAPVRGEGGPGLAGEIIHLAYGADPATRTYLAKIAMDNSAETLRPGMIVQVAFSRRELTQVVAVPLYALVDRDGVKVVYVEEGGKALLRQVKVGPIIGSLAVIEEGLAPGEHLIVKGQHLVNSGASVVEEGN
ncbi:MAG: efflux RND transporter periplasmic adaptor subunit [Desulfoarculaceae bacterium]|nr:efflux RND transporter periplasmic adaptor subunit [Desulfoarculaceae bacterium]